VCDRSISDGFCLMKKMNISDITYIIMLSLACGCGGPEPKPAAKPQPAVPVIGTGGENLEDSEDDLNVSGTLGTIPTHLIQERLEPKFPSFQKCFIERSEALEFVAGKIELYFRVKVDGSVRRVFPRGSSIGDRQTERCIVEIAARTRFPNPKGGGEAEFAWQLEVDTMPDVRPPVAWDSERVSSIARQNAGSIKSCGKYARYTVTTYVAPGGKIMSAGAAASAFDGPDALDCVVEAVRTWKMPDPGSYPAKVTFNIP
jgi:hypothetical protein